jgi:hypothetical protein
MKEISFEKMENVEGGGCAEAIGIALASGAIVISASYIAPWIWANPKTWYAAATIFAGNSANIYEQC